MKNAPLPDTRLGPGPYLQTRAQPAIALCAVQLAALMCVGA